MSLLERLDRFVGAGSRFHQWRSGALHAASPVTPVLDAHGPYLLARAPGVPELWGALHSALRTRRPLAILPPASPVEEAILLRQLPPQPPAGAAVALFTSGTTGEPKAVLHSEASLLASAAQLARAFPGAAPTASLLPAWGMAGLVFHCVFPAERGAPVLFSAEPFLEWSGQAGRLLRELEVGLVTLNPFLLEMLLRAGIEPGWTGSVVSLTAPLRQSQRVALSLLAGTQGREIYGMTEAAGPVLLDGTSLGAQTRLSAAGELEIRGPQMMLGYSSNGVFEPAPDWFPTGDLFTASGGALAHQARLRDLIDTGGRKVAPRLIEEALEAMPAIAECLAFPVELSGVERPGLVFVRKPGCTEPEAALAASVESFLAGALSPELRPRWWREVSAIPRLKNGKPDRRAARSQWGCPAQGPKAGT